MKPSEDISMAERALSEARDARGYLPFETLDGLLASMNEWRTYLLYLELTAEALIEENRALREALQRAKGDAPPKDNVIHADFGGREYPPGGAA